MSAAIAEPILPGCSAVMLPWAKEDLNLHELALTGT